MKSSSEIELKLQIDPASLAELLASATFPSGATTIREQISTYYDTPGHKLKRAGFSLRIRQIGDRRIQTIKAEGAETASLFARREWEHDIAGDTPEIDTITGALSGLLSADARLTPIFVATVKRASVMIEQAGNRIELVADQGEIVAGDRRSTISEIELELLEGDPAVLFAAARKIAKKVPLKLGVRAKSERGYALLGDEVPAVKSEPVRLNADMNAGAAFAAIAGNCIRHFRLNEDILLASAAAEPVHQCRVAFRRLRSALSIFKEIVAGPEHDRLTAELRWISNLLGDVRNIDVLIDRLTDRDALAKLRAARKRRYGRLRKALDSARMRAMMIDLTTWISIGDWRTEPDVADLRDRPALVFAHDALDKLRRRIGKRGQHLATIDEEERHRVRILGKKLRYAAEFFSALYPGKKAGRRRETFLDALERLQAALGDLNDLSNGRALLHALGVANAEALLLAKHDPERMLAKAEDSLDQLLDGKRFWR